MTDKNLSDDALLKDQKTEEANDSEFFDDDFLTEWEWVQSIKNLRKKSSKFWWLRKIIGVFIFIFTILAIVLYSVNYFFLISLKWKDINSFESQYIEFVKSNILKHFDKTDTSESLDSSGEKDYTKRASWMNQYLSNSSIPFYQKNFAKWKFVQDSLLSFNSNNSKLESTKSLLVRYRFLPKDLDYLMKDIRILPILSALNSINIYMIDYVYLQIWKFNRDILLHALRRSSITNEFSYINAIQISKFVSEDIQKMWEAWVNFYLKNIKFNYMYSEWDSDSFVARYYTNEFSRKFWDILNDRIEYLGNLDWSTMRWNKQEQEKFKLHYINLIKDIYSRTNQLIENQEINNLPISVTLLSYDPQTQMLSFNVKISLEDQYNARVSVIKIATDLVSLLRQSRLILWSDISIKDIKVKQTNKIVWWAKILYHETDLLFKTFVQSDNNIEVSDSKR